MPAVGENAAAEDVRLQQRAVRAERLAGRGQRSEERTLAAQREAVEGELVENSADRVDDDAKVVERAVDRREVRIDVLRAVELLGARITRVEEEVIRVDVVQRGAAGTGVEHVVAASRSCRRCRGR